MGPGRVDWIIRSIQNLSIDLRFGRSLRGNLDTRNAALGAYKTVNTDYADLRALFAGRIRASDVLVDVGCGKGRVINYWLWRGHRGRIVGLELDEELARRTRERLRRWKNVTIVTGDAVANIPEDGTVFYLYNPFNAQLLKRFLDRLYEVSEAKSDLRVFYYSSKHLDVLQADGRWNLETFVLGPEEVAIATVT